MANLKKINIRIRKDGKPYKSDIQKARQQVKENFEFYKSFEGENLPDQVKGYYRQIDAAKEQAAKRIHNPETGRFFSGKTQKIVEKALKNFAADTGRDFEELKQMPDIVRDVYLMEKERKESRMVPVDAVIDMTSDKDVKTIFSIDQNGNKREISAVQAKSFLTNRTKKAIQSTGGFNANTRITLNRVNGELEIFIPDFSGLNEEQINELTDELMEEGSYSVTKSPPKKRKANAAKKRTGKKPNRSRSGKKAN